MWACVRLIADTISMMPLDGFTFDMTGDKKVRRPHPLPTLLRKPSSDTTTPEWLYMLVVSVLLRGNTWGRITARDALGYPTQIELVHPDRVSPALSKTGRPQWRIGDMVYDAADVFHFRGYPMAGSRLGLSPIAYAATSIRTEHAVKDFAHDFFRDGAHPTSILTSPETMQQDQARSLKERFTASLTGREPAVLSGGVTYQQIQVNPNESQFLETQKYNVPTIARMFGVPPEMVAGEAGNSMSYSNREQRSLDYLTYSVQPWLTRLEAAFAQLMPGKQHVRFDTSVLLRTDLETRMKATAIGIASHQLLPDEARAMGDLPPFTEAEKALADLVPMTVTPSGLPKSLKGAAPAGVGSDPAADPAPVPSGESKP